MPIIEFPTISYDDIKDGARRAIDKINDTFRQLDWLLRRLDRENIPGGIPPEPPPDKPDVVDEYGINDEYLDYYPNKAYNSSFEVFNDKTRKPDYWDTSGVVSADANFEGGYSLKLTSGQYAIQCEDETGAGPADPAWWSWCNGKTRIAFQIKSPAGSGQVRVSVWQGGAAVPLSFWVHDDKKDKDVEVITDPPHYLTFPVNKDWVNSRVTFAALPSVSGGRMKLRFDNVGSVDIYIDAVIIRADWTGKWPGLHKYGPASTPRHTRAKVGGRNCYVQNTAPPSADWDLEVGDVWVDTS